NYAQHFAMSDHFHATGFGPSTIGAIELVSGNTSTVGDTAHTPIGTIAGAVDNHTAYSNLNPPKAYDGCSSSTGTYALDGDFGAGPSKNVGDLMNAAHVSWGWFQGGFTPSSLPAAPLACGASHTNVAGAVQTDYDPHHNPFSYYASTSNPNHTATNGHVGEPDDPANHNYDQTVFDAAVKAGNLPAVSFLKAGHYQDGHPGYSDPIDEQTHLVNTINEIEASPDWASTAIIVAWDDSDGWYDHQAPTITRTSSTPEDTLTGAGQCGKLPGQATDPVRATDDRCGFGPRLPFLVISPYAKQNYVDHTETDQTSILRFIEDNWSLGRIGGGSADVEAKPIDGMFDFAGAKRAPALTLDASTGALPGTPRVPSPAPTPTPTPAPVVVTPPVKTPAPASPSVPTVPGLGKLTCKGKLSGSKKVVLSCTAKKAVKPKTSVRARLLLKKKLLGTASATVKGTKVTITIKTTSKIKHGKYTLTLGIATAGSAATAQTGTLKL
ncbi:MAG: alkaline phosphatase family protein, partial [Patulibacter sp.]|nr:alkaline phosphatase family protein [Patulibacter sp.]